MNERPDPKPDVTGGHGYPGADCFETIDLRAEGQEPQPEPKEVPPEVEDSRFTTRPIHKQLPDDSYRL